MDELIRRTKRNGPAFEGRLLAIDPGETTGWALFEGSVLKEAGQFRVGTDTSVFDQLVNTHTPDYLVIENYRVYASRAAQHVGSEVVTVQYVGILKFVAQMYSIPFSLQMAYQAKGWVTDLRLRQLNLFQTGHRHANDAIRHGVYWLLFGRGPTPE